MPHLVDFFHLFGHGSNADLKRYMNRHCLSQNFNDRQFRCVVGKLCEHYCIYFCIANSKRIDMHKIVRKLTSNTGHNDVLVHACVCSQK